MANKVGTITIEWVTRACEVDGRPGLFHIWEQWLHREPLRGGNYIGKRNSHNGAPIGQVYGIIEFFDRNETYICCKCPECGHMAYSDYQT